MVYLGRCNFKLNTCNRFQNPIYEMIMSFIKIGIIGGSRNNWIRNAKTVITEELSLRNQAHFVNFATISVQNTLHKKKENNYNSSLLLFEK